MSQVHKAFHWLARAALFWLPAAVWAAGGKSEPIVFVADSRRYSGWIAWWANLCNESLLYFTIATVLMIPVVGALLGVLTDFFMARIGINLRSRTLAEH